MRRIATVPALARTRGEVQDEAMVRCGEAILSRIHRAFLVKMRGGTDETGDKWRDLSPTTVAYRRTRGMRGKREKSRDSRPSQGLTKKQQERWWEVYQKQLIIFRGNRGHAAAVAWIVLKGEGAKTLLDKYGNVKVDILRESGALLDSLKPGVTSEYQVFRLGSGEVVVGTDRPWAWTHHQGTKRTPQRRLWPEVRKWPESWWESIQRPALQGLLELVVEIVGK